MQPAHRGTQAPENPGNPPVFKPGFVCGQKAGFDGFNFECQYSTEKRAETKGSSNAAKI